MGVEQNGQELTWDSQETPELSKMVMYWENAVK